MSTLLDELLIEGWRTGSYGPGFDPAIFNALSGQQSDQQQLNDAFFQGGFVPQPPPPAPVAAPPPTVAPPPPKPSPLPEVVVTAGRAAAPILGGLGAILVPSPIAPEPDPRTLEPFFPAPAPELETVVITGQRPPPVAPPPSIAAAPSESPLPTWLQPTSWGNLLRFGAESLGRFAGRTLRREAIGEIVDGILTLNVTGERGRTASPVQPAIRTAPVAVDRGGVPADALETLVVSASRPSTTPRPGIAAPRVSPAPFVEFDFDPLGLPELAARPRTIARPITDVLTGLAPLVGTPTTTNPTIFSPYLVPTAAPAPRAPPPTRAPRPPTVVTPTDIFDPILVVDPLTADPTGLSPPANKTDNCVCPKPKKRKPREPRAVCRSGSYTQTRTGIIYTPRRTFQCP